MSVIHFQQAKSKKYPHIPNYITIMPPGNVLKEKIDEMGIDAVELAKRMQTPLETVQKLLNAETMLTLELAEKIETATGMSSNFMIRVELGFQENIRKAVEHPEIPAYFNGSVIKLVSNPKLIVCSHYALIKDNCEY